MDNKALLVLIDLLVKDQIANIDIPEGVRGPRGFKGRDGNDFTLEDNKQELIQLIEEHSNVTLTSEQIESLQGKDGKDGKSISPEDVIPQLTEELHLKINQIKDDLKLKFSDLTDEEIERITGPRGLKGSDGLDFIFEDHSDKIQSSLISLVENLKEDLKLKFSDLTEEDKLQLRGGRGQKGKSGKDFDYEENRNNIESSLRVINKEFLPELKLNFSGLSEDEIESLRGPRGHDGSDGESFYFDDHRLEIQNQICEYINSVHETLKLRFEDLSEENINSLKLKFSDLTEEERLQLKGARGQRGKQGIEGETGFSAYEIAIQKGYKGSEEEWVKSLKGERGERGVVGSPGISGLNGRNGVDGKDGKDGRDGKDAPQIVALELESDKKNFSLQISLEDGTKIKSNEVKFPASVVNNYYSSGSIGSGGSGSGGSGTSNPTEYFDEGITIGTAEKVNFSGPNVVATKVGDTVQVVISDTDTNTTDLKVFSGPLSLISTTDELEFDSNDFEVTDNAGRAVISLKPVTASAEIGIYDEYNLVTATTKNINFIGDYVTVRQRVPISEWDLLNNVTPDMASYLGDGLTDTVDVFIDLPDSSLLKNVTCLSDVYVGAVVLINSSEIAENALADSYGNSNVIGLVESKSSPTVCDIRVSGISSGIFSGLDVSLDYYLSDSVAGGVSPVVPTTSGHIKLKLGQAFGTTKFLFSKGERVVRL